MLLKNETQFQLERLNTLFDELILLSRQTQLTNTVKKVVTCQLKIHKTLSQVLLVTTTIEMTSKGKSLAPDKKLRTTLEKNI